MDPIRTAADQLSQSTRGREAMQALLTWITDHGCGLDKDNQLAVHTLLDYAWGGKAGTVTDAMRKAVGPEI